MKPFRDRRQAGRELAQRLQRLGLGTNVVVLALARGGIPVAAEVADALGVPLEVVAARKIEAPFDAYGAVGAVAFGGVTAYDATSLAKLGLTELRVESARKRAVAELGRIEHAYRGGKPAPDVRGKTVLLVDDGMVTGATLYAAVLATRALGPSSIVAAVPASVRDAVARLEEVADRVVSLATLQPDEPVDASYTDVDSQRPDVRASTYFAAHGA